MSVKRQP